MLHAQLTMYVMSKVKAELESQAEVVASAYSKVEHADRENKASLARAKLVEGEVKPPCDLFYDMSVGKACFSYSTTYIRLVETFRME